MFKAISINVKETVRKSIKEQLIRIIKSRDKVLQF